MCLSVPGMIVSIDGIEPLSRQGKVNFGGIFKDVYLAYAPEAQVGDYVIVHAGFAISILNEKEASRVFESLREMERLDEKGSS